ncbi:uncharacterized protein CXQ87_000733 [Candidozyma duobushaemuli]|uniref:Ribosomal lysine N-methyltransferase 4 n=1 Tax=Candidozyma duobushaemuli TaxID=1231522 RepID=A0A2V1AJM0_9ASCO|nr:uncharacterized protein CXQ87_000733 [[Candida] duobushaemulonis]PVH17834.1 hypothetical protein CXQ87_000733 [[Candida] duobushaemulonis]
MSFTDKTETFVQWLKDNKVEISDKVEIKDLRSIGQGRALMAIEDIASDEDLFKLPQEVFINATNNSLIKEYPDLKDKILDLPQWEALILVLVYEWQVKGKDSKWAPYFDILPIGDSENYKFDQLVFWSEEEIDHLKPSYIVKRIGKASADALLQKVRDIAASFGIDIFENMSQSDLHKTAALIMSYSFDVQRDNGNAQDEDDEIDSPDVRNSSFIKSMLPLADTLNANTSHHNASLIQDNESLVMRSIKPIEKGQQIYNTYSDHPNAEILRRYGYVEPEGSTSDFGEVSLDLIKKYFVESTSLSATNVEEIISILLEIQEEEDEEFIVDTFDCYVSGEVIFEMCFLAQLLTVLAKINDKTPFNDESSENKARGIRRVFKKCYQLVESGKLTESLKESLFKILDLRISEYPEVGVNFDRSQPQTREFMAGIVLQSELKALRECAKGEKLFSIGDTHYTFIPDEKLVNNIMKKSIFSEASSKKQKV